jgi:hypothetical protein
MVETTPVESSPPDNGTPTGTSEIRWRATAVVPRELLAYESSLRLGANSVFTAGFQ